MIKYWISNQISWIAVWKLNKKRTEYLDKEYLTRDEVIWLLVILAKYIKWEWNETVITSNWKPEITIKYE